MTGTRARQAGFTLLEVLIALAICTAAVIALYRGTSVGLKSAGAIAGEAGAAALAQSLLARAGVETPFEAGIREGDGGGMTWRIITTKHRDGSQQDTRKVIPLPAYWITVQVSWRDNAPGRRRSIELTTLKLDELQSGERR